MRFDRKIVANSLLLALGGVAGFLLFGPVSILAQSDNTPPVLSGVAITSLTATSVMVTWQTDEEADSLVNYGLTKDYGIVRDPLPNKKSHQIILSDLEPSTTYQLRVVSSDAFGNQALSGNYAFTTKGVVSIKELEKIPPEERAVVEKAVVSIRELKSVEGLRAVAKELGETARKVLEAPVIIGTPKIDEIGATYAVVSWATDQESNSVVRYARDEDYKSGAENPFTTEAGNDPGERTRDHSVRIEGLTPGTVYRFRVESEGEFGLRGISRESSFTTKAQLPEVSGFRVVKVEADSATLAWRTNIPSAGVVEYTNVATKEVKSAGTPVFATTQVVKIAGLRLGNRYMAVVKAENAIGERVTSNPLYFTTVRDTAPPVISKVSNESTLYPSAEAKVQTIVSWATDEPAYCQFFYREGLNPNIESRGLGLEKEPRTNHVQVITEFVPSTVYQFWVECKDPAGNSTKSENFVLFTPNKEKSIIDIILENFEGAFGWVKNIGK
jgi:hypothetical protein